MAKEKKQIWCYKGSSAWKLAQILRKDYTVRALARNSEDKLSKGFGELSEGRPIVLLLDAARDGAAIPSGLDTGDAQVRMVSLAANARTLRTQAKRPKDSKAKGYQSLKDSVFAELPRSASPALLKQTIAAAFDSIEMSRRERALRRELEQAHRAMEDLNRIGAALSSERNREKLLALILRKAREITHADAGSLYEVEEDKKGERWLRFKLTQNDSRPFPFAEFILPITENSLAGYVALHGEALNLPDAYNVPEGLPFHFNIRFDEESGYRTRSLLTLPMKNPNGDVLGVLQLINCKRNPATRLEDIGAVEREVHSFPDWAVRMARSLASQAAVAYENSKLYEEIETLFEGFVMASVKAIEQRDPTTSGHSFRVSTLTTGLAEIVDSVAVGPYAATHFSHEQMKEIRYAALLHDFGKVGVKEDVLLKAKKLYPTQLDLVKQRFEYIRKELEARVTQQKLKLALERSREEALAAIGLLDQEFMRAAKELDEYLQFILRADEPSVTGAGNFGLLDQISRKTYCDTQGVERQYLDPEEVKFLSVAQGTLDDDERKQIESHVVHSFNFLMQIPWTRALGAIPWIARAHHEKLDGSGYPYKLHGDEIPMQTKMMTICDIFDALSASDRPYKKAVPAPRALDILEASVRERQLDGELFRLFVEAKIYERPADHV
jgi:HD-GYP domain-containing protein (c-di-GMP phosphodiesterase class II)